VPHQPGRGIVAGTSNARDAVHLLTARPEVSTIGGAGELVRAIAAGWPGARAPQLKTLPLVLPYDNLDLDRGSGLRLPIGIAEADLHQVELDFAADPHFLLFGDAECGKTSFLRALATTVTRRFTPDQARLILVDYRRGLLDMPETEHRIGYGMQAQKTLELMQSVAGYLERRLPAPDVTPQQLRERSWWTGPELFVLVDDYDLVVAGPANPLTPLLEYLHHARDVGLHLILTRRAGGASRALYEPILQRLRELSASVMVMSGPRDEGPLGGVVRPEPMPPGRGHLVTRREGTRVVQLAYLPPFDAAPER
jgi:S-DNA-T family DNA segregation ATPase FtsK/SpoIIIE